MASGSFAAPDHEYPSYLELKLTATDSKGLSATVIRRIDPKTVTLTFQSSPTGLQLAVGSVVADGALHADGDPGLRQFGVRDHPADGRCDDVHL